MMLTRAISFFFLLAGFASPAPAQVYKCTDANGKISYTNENIPSRNCKLLSGEQPVSTIPMRATAASFPKVSSDAQKVRDNARREVLESELANEQTALEEARKTLAAQEAVRNGNERNYQKVLDRLQPLKEDVARRERNIEALNKEISGLR